MDLVSARVIDAAGKLGIDKSSASRRVKQAIKLGYLKNED
jgi:DNA-binding MarR family transcriptional regulator